MILYIGSSLPDSTLKVDTLHGKLPLIKLSERDSALHLAHVIDSLNAKQPTGKNSKDIKKEKPVVATIH